MKFVAHIITGYVNISNQLVTPDSKILAELDMYLTYDQYKILYSSERYDKVNIHTWAFTGTGTLYVSSTKFFQLYPPPQKKKILNVKCLLNIHVYLYIGGCYTWRL